MATPRLLTIPISHYCEKVRWALERAGVDYVEEAHLQMIHRFYAVKAGGGRKVPVLITDEGVFNESSEIIRWIDERLPVERRLVPADLRPRIDAIEGRLDEGLGVEGRRWMYSMLMTTDLPRRYGLGPLPRWERAAVPVVLPVMRLYLKAFMDAEPAKAADALASVDEAFDWIEELIADGRPYLVGDRFTSADLTFAALSAAVLAPERYGVELPQPEDAPPGIRREMERLRERPAGRFAARLVAEERPWPPANRPARVN
ncbi:MAG TPA: glutathione S-transferase family protein [Solirubrobacterales bacterium]|nr:glutathione S-transferase family protein [Solirubrobacterales bacterium]